MMSPPNQRILPGRRQVSPNQDRLAIWPLPRFRSLAAASDINGLAPDALLNLLLFT